MIGKRCSTNRTRHDVAALGTQLVCRDAVIGSPNAAPETTNTYKRDTVLTTVPPPSEPKPQDPTTHAILSLSVVIRVISITDMYGRHEPIDVVIIGGGIAGCYAAYRLRQQHASLRVLVIEAGDRLGGRAQTDVFHGVPVTTGAGLGRFGKDNLLTRLMTQLKFPVNVFTTGHKVLAIDDLSCHVETDFKTLRQHYVDQRERLSAPLHVTFKDFASKRLPDYDGFVACTGFSDFEHADAADVFFRYGFEDNYSLWPAFAVPWSTLVAAMMRGVPHVLDTRVSALRRTRNHTYVVTCVDVGDDTTWQIHVPKVIIATDVSAVQALLPTCSHLYKHIHGQPFIKIYGIFDARSAEILATILPKTGLIVFPGSPLQKIVHIRDAVYMIAYSDNAKAVALRSLSLNDNKSRRDLAKLVEAAVRLPVHSLRLLDTRTYFWRIGTHYYDPFATRAGRSKTQFVEAAQRPMPGVFVAGECVALRQGWVEGALQSVENIL